jgi:hypothetical protein
MYGGVPLTVENISAELWTRLLMPKSLTLTHQFP